jgi:predicted nucleic acid-binding protein
LSVYLLDADVIIWCEKNNKLGSVFKAKRIEIPKVIYEEVRYYEKPETKERVTITFNQYIKEGSLKIIDTPVDEEVRRIFNIIKNCINLGEIDKGEIECIALAKKNNKYKFCTGDKSSIRLMSFLRLSDQAISLEEILRGAGNLRESFTIAYKNKYLKEGAELFVQYGDWK